MLFCSGCGCASDERARGWVAFICEDPDEVDDPCVFVYCPPCAKHAFGCRTETAEGYV
jgi:hypothetical protein